MPNNEADNTLKYHAVVGCHRSGTSMLTNLLRLSGFGLGDNNKVLIEADDENQNGYWENSQAQAINDKALAALGGAWYYPMRFSAGWQKQPFWNGLLAQVGQFFSTSQSGFLFKDPRTTVCLPLWLRARPDLDLVLIIRHPLAVANSLNRRKFSLSIEHGLWLWMQYNYYCLRDGNKNLAAVVSYEKYLQEPQAELQSVLYQLGRHGAEVKIDKIISTVSHTTQSLKGAQWESSLLRFEWIEECWYLLRQVWLAFKQKDVSLKMEGLANINAYFERPETKERILLLEHAAQPSIESAHKMASALDNMKSGYSGPAKQMVIKGQDGPAPIASIIIVNYNVADLVVACVKSLLDDPQRPTMQIIILDNSCYPDQAAMLEELANANSDVTLLVNSENMGFARANNRGLAIAKGEYVVLLNPDTLAAPGWFDELRNLLKMHTEIGLVNPLTNRVGHYAALASLDVIGDTPQETIWRAREVTTILKNKWFEMPSLGFFCVMGYRRVFQEVGPLDECYEVGGYEDDDYCKRVINMGYKLAVSLGSFVYHYQDKSFSLLPIETRQEIALSNQRHFVSTWGSYHNLLELPYFFQALRQSLDLVSAKVKDQSKKLLDLPLSILKKGEQSISWQYTHISESANDGELFARFRLLHQELIRAQGSQQVLAESLAELPQYLSALSKTNTFKAIMFMTLCIRQLRKETHVGIGHFIKAVINFGLGRKESLRELLDVDPIMHYHREINYLLARNKQDNSIALHNEKTEYKEDACNIRLNTDGHPYKHAGARSQARVAYFTNQLLDVVGQRPRYGGGERYCMTLTTLLEDLGMKVDLFQLGQHSFEGVYEGKFVKAIPMGKKQFSEFNLDATEAFFKLSLNYDYVIYNLPELSAGTMRNDAINICHGIWFDHNNYGLNVKFRQPEWFQYLNRVFASPRMTISVDTNSINVIRSLWPEMALKMRFIPNFVDTEIFNPPHRSRENTPLRVIFPRRSQVNRGSRILGDILREVPHDLRFYWVGEGDGPDTKLIMDIAKSDPRLEFYSASFKEMPQWYQDCEICVIPTVACEGTSLSLLEGQASGCAVVTTNVGGLTDLVQDGVNGLVVDAMPGQIAAAINRLVEDRELRRRLQKEGVVSARRFSLQLWREKWIKVLQELGWI